MLTVLYNKIYSFNYEKKYMNFDIWNYYIFVTKQLISMLVYTYLKDFKIKQASF